MFEVESGILRFVVGFNIIIFMIAHTAINAAVKTASLQYFLQLIK